jgi:tRNA A37 threonylcarbamoyladenosine synthetase subunit TsaC/SUA5/YrdC
LDAVPAGVSADAWIEKFLSKTKLGMPAHPILQSLLLALKT